MTTKTVCVTGGGGFVGGHIVEMLLENSDEKVVVIDVLDSETSTKEEKLETLAHLQKVADQNGGEFKFYELDVRDQSALVQILKVEQPTAIVHAAALVQDRQSVVEAQRYISTNVVGSQVLLDSILSADLSLESLCYISTRSVVGNVDAFGQKINEHAAVRPANPYGASKLGAEGLFCSFSNTEKIPVTVLRFMPMYGPRCRNDMMVRRLLERILTGESIEQFGDGSAERDWLYVRDGAEAVVKSVANPPIPGNYRILTIGTGVSTTLSELIKLCENVVGQAANIVHRATPIGDATITGVADWSLAEREINWRPNTSLRDGLELTLAYFEKRTVA